MDGKLAGFELIQPDTFLLFYFLIDIIQYDFHNNLFLLLN